MSLLAAKYLPCTLLVSVTNVFTDVWCLTTAYDTETGANITMTYIPAHLYYMLFELIKVSMSVCFC